MSYMILDAEGTKVCNAVHLSPWAKRKADKHGGKVIDMYTSRTVYVAPVTELIADVAIVASEGGINYWAAIVKRNLKPTNDAGNYIFTGMTIRSDEYSSDALAPRDFTLSPFTILLTMQRIRDDAYLLPARNDVRDILRDALLTNDASNIDAEVADIIVQIACFGELIFG